MFRQDVITGHSDFYFENVSYNVKIPATESAKECKEQRKRSK